MPNRIIYSNYPENAKVQIYGSDPDNPIQSTDGALVVEVTGVQSVSFNGTPTVAIEGTLPINGIVEITGTPTVNIGNDLTVAMLPEVTIASLPAIELSGTQTVAIGNSVTVASLPAVSITGTVPVTGAVGILGTPTVAIGNSITVGSLPAVSITGTVPVTGAVGILGTPVVSITGTPTVAISPSTPVTLTVAGALPVSIAGHGFTSILVTAISGGGLISAGAFNTQGIDVSQFSDYSYAVHSESSGLATTYTIQPQVAPILNNNYYANSGSPGTINVTVLGGTSNIVLTNNDLLRYSRLAISGGGVGANLALTIYLQGQY